MTTLNLQVGQSSDDCMRKLKLITAEFILAGNDLYCGDYTSNNYDYSSGMRFTGVTIGQGDTIDAATMQFKARALFTAIPTTYIEGEDAADAVTFVDAGDYDGRDRTGVSVSWTPPAWAIGTWYTTSELKTIVQAVIDRSDWASGNALVTFWRDAPGWGGSQKLINSHSFNSDPTFAPKLDIDYSEGFITGAAVLSGVGSMAAAAALTLPGAVAMSGVGSMSVLGTIGAIQLGAAALSGAGSMGAAGVITASGKAVMSGAGSMAAVGRRIRTGAVAMSGIGSMSAIGEVAGLLEGRVALSGVGSMSVIGQRIVGGKAAISGIGSVAVAAASVLAGKVSLSGVGSMAVIGETGEVLYTVFGGVLRTIDPADYPDGAQFFFEVSLSASVGDTARARLFNLTLAAVVADSEVTATRVLPLPVRSPALVLASGPNIYRAEYGGSLGGTYTIYAVDVLVESD